ncbi:tocopherol cyclase family protein [Jeotgalibaca porci]|uniref:tocopherol cyclase family protein n=1 Tax=Jeotgalibaca porci TaxID=1868793 RepID=UPI003F8F1CAA
MRKDRNLFQGNLSKKNYFEGWYYKQVSTNGKTAISFIPGISLNASDPHCFIQYIIVDETLENDISTGYVRFPVDSFVWNDEPFAVKIEDNFFSESFVSVHLESATDIISGNLKLGPLTPIESTVLRPTIMGPFAYIPKMECYHGVTSMNHYLDGSLEINGRIVAFSNGKGYIEKDWGTKFPKNYVWLQSNHFEEPDTSLFFSMAYIPFYVRDFLGFISNIQVNGKEYRFATYNNSKIKLSLPYDDTVLVTMENSKAKVKIFGKADQMGNLQAPVLSGMDKTIKEGVSGTIELELWDKENNTHYQGIGSMAGIEIVDAEDLVM